MAREKKCIGEYEKRGEIGRGTYGTVYEGVHCQTLERVAIKKVIGKPSLGDQEATLLRKCKDAQHVVQLLDVVLRNGKTYLVLEYMDSDLETVIKATDELPVLPVAHVKTYLRMLLEGVQELHSRNILHRDLKPNNLLISQRTDESKKVVAKITDFGMAAVMEPTDAERSIQVITRAYRPPELFFGDDHYGFSVDMWSVGCIFGEMLLRKPMFDGASDIDQLSQIFNMLGSPTENGWEAAAELPFFLRFKDTNPVPLKEHFEELSAHGVDLLRRFLTLDPKKRITLEDALAHPFFKEEPLPAPSEDLVVVTPPDRFQTKKRAADAEWRDDEAADSSFVIKGRRIV
ncbi:TPA: hypothetical protein N0F65_010509 [Lagenidium giganteum]|uniref:Cyclin-dependent kinase 2 homolog n=1 Tax=Lagenidium giganteum TaxID=4803 RepID=A0AAV2ZBE1_9STRA|nr:TPA: hypothetical protein N0F65_010509 [Lagenidium giganteum]